MRFQFYFEEIKLLPHTQQCKVAESGEKVVVPMAVPALLFYLRVSFNTRGLGTWRYSSFKFQ